MIPIFFFFFFVHQCGHGSVMTPLRISLDFVLKRYLLTKIHLSHPRNWLLVSCGIVTILRGAGKMLLRIYWIGSTLLNKVKEGIITLVMIWLFDNFQGFRPRSRLGARSISDLHELNVNVCIFVRSIWDRSNLDRFKAPFILRSLNEIDRFEIARGPFYTYAF